MGSAAPGEPGRALLAAGAAWVCRAARALNVNEFGNFSAAAENCVTPGSFLSSGSGHLASDSRVFSPARTQQKCLMWSPS